MLIQFSVENFASIKERAVLSLEPSSETLYPENINHCGEYQALKTVAVYGANAAGKTKLFLAFSHAVYIIQMSNSSQLNQALPIIPFKFDKESEHKPSFFEFIFIADDGKRYIYGFSADQKMIYEEYLYFYPLDKEILIFERKNKDQYVFADAHREELEPCVRWNIENKLFLATATSWNARSTKAPFDWLEKSIYSFMDITKFILPIERYKSVDREKYIAFTEKLLQQADINVSHININIRKIGEDNPGFVAYGQNLQPSLQETLEIYTEHKIMDDNDRSKTYRLNLGEESLGTNQMFFWGPVLMDAFETGKVIMIDEIEKSLHTMIVQYIIRLFQNPEINAKGAQLIFTTHDTALLSSDIFRRDQIYFIEKDNESGKSELFSLDEFSEKEGENIEQSYLLGRYGAIPFIKED